MITVDRPAFYANERFTEWCGLSTDDKSNLTPSNGDEFYEIDTGKLYKFDEEANNWVEQPIGGSSEETVTSVNGKTGAVTLTASDVNALPSTTTIPTNVVQYTAQTLTDTQKTQARTNIGAGTSNFSGSYNDLTNKPTIPDTSGLMIKSNPTGTGSLSMNRKSGSATGAGSVTLGMDCTASGADSVAEGLNTNAKGTASHAEGSSSTADGYAGHAEGAGTYSCGLGQHVEGVYNVHDTVDAETNKATYAHILGNGTVDFSAGSYTMSNAHTIDWDGNAWFAGDVYVGSTSGTNKDGGSKKLITASVTEVLDMNSNRIANLAAPTNDTDAATKAYVDALKTLIDKLTERVSALETASGS